MKSNTSVRSRATWTPKEDSQLRNLVRAGASGKAIAEALGRSRPSVWTRKLNLGIPGRISRSRKKEMRPESAASANSSAQETLQARFAREVQELPVVLLLTEVSKSLGVKIKVTLEF